MSRRIDADCEVGEPAILDRGAKDHLMSVRVMMGGGFTVLDGASLVTGAAVALVHLRTPVSEFDGPSDWAWGCLMFAWLTITSAGPFAYLARRFVSRPEGYPRLGDRLWALAGVPWLLSALVRTGESPEVVAGRIDPAYLGTLGLGLALVAAVSVPFLVVNYLLVDPSRPSTADGTPWTNRLGLTLTMAWPVQCFVGLALVG